MNDSAVRQVADLHAMTMEELRGRWRELFGSDPPTYGRAQLIKRLAYRLQELAFGGLSEGTGKRLRALAREHDGDSGAPRRRSSQAGPVAGTRLIREWDGRRHEVTVTRNGFEYQGRPYRSLSAIARAITGTPWNGPAFFGLRKRRRS